jgi:hypothetical protein
VTTLLPDAEVEETTDSDLVARLQRRVNWHRAQVARRGRRIDELRREVEHLERVVESNEDLLTEYLHELHDRRTTQTMAEAERDRLHGMLELLAEILKSATIAGDQAVVSSGVFALLDQIVRTQTRCGEPSLLWAALSRFRLALELIAGDPPEGTEICEGCEELARGLEAEQVAHEAQEAATRADPVEVDSARGPTDESRELTLVRLLSTTDAGVWATEFCRRFPRNEWGAIIGWFANAIEVGRDAGARQIDPHEAFAMDAESYAVPLDAERP